MTKPISKMTPKDVVNFHRQMEKRCDVKFVNSEFFRKKLIATAEKFFGDLDDLLLEIVDPDLLKVRPCSVNGVILLPYQIGTPKIEPLRQVLTAVEEVTHSIRQKDYKGNALNWYGEYFSKDTFRAVEESSGKEAKDQVYFWQFGVVRPFSFSYGGGYFLSDNAVAVAQSSYDGNKRLMEGMGRGQTTHFAARMALKTLRAQGVTRA